MNNFQTFVARIDKAKTKDDFEKLDKSVERLYYNGVLTGNELIQIDRLIHVKQQKTLVKGFIQ